MTNSTPLRNAEKIDVAYVANLARIQLTAAELQTFQAQLTQIVDYVKDLEQVDVSAIEPMAHTGQITNVLRKDEERRGLESPSCSGQCPRARQRTISGPEDHLMRNERYAGVE